MFPATFTARLHPALACTIVLAASPVPAATFVVTSTAETFSISLGVTPEAGFITATATSPAGSTSEFSNCLAAPQPDGLHADGFE